MRRFSDERKGRFSAAVDEIAIENRASVVVAGTSGLCEIAQDADYVQADGMERPSLPFTAETRYCHHRPLCATSGPSRAPRLDRMETGLDYSARE